MVAKRRQTDTHAWCSHEKHMVPHEGFAKGQTICKACRKVAYNHLNFSKGYKCGGCEKPVANTSRTFKCRRCYAAWVKETNRHSTPKRRINAQGYAVVNQAHGHPNAWRNGKILEHVKVMSDTLGRALLPGENVHHINGVKTDNRPENLELWVSTQPSGQRPADLVAWAREIIERYGDEV